MARGARLARLLRTSLLIAAAGCDELEHPSLVKDLRLLAVAVEPPEVILDPAAPAAGPPELEVTPLLADPRGGGRPVTWTVRACGNDPLAPSAPGAGTEGAAGYPAGGARSTVGSARCPPPGPTSWSLLPDGETRPAGASLRFALGATQLAAAFAADVFPGHLGKPHGGFDLGLPISLEFTASAGDERVVGLKRVVFWAGPLREGQQPNRNPRILEVRAFADRDPETLSPREPVEVVAAGQAQVLAPGQTLWLEPAGAEAEPYVTRVIDRFTDEVRLQEVASETLTFAFYASAGRFVPAQTSSELSFGARPTARRPLESRYEAPAAAGDVTVWIVVRDERGGSSFLERRLTVHEPARD
jgi:hypothetical protein